MNTNRSSTAQPQTEMNLDVGQSLPIGNSNNENRAPPFLSPTLSSMLKTATETGDVDQFARRPPRVPQLSKPPRITGGTYNGFALQQPQRNFVVANRFPADDDRKRLPSYAKDAISEVVSMYETAGQKSPSRTQFARGTGNRSYSMTQTSYLHHPLSIHRSYTSLRSQPELNLMQRPRSPFPYPVHSRHVVFQPTSPVLIDGRNSDIIPCADNHQMPNCYNIARSTSPSIYVNKRVPASLRRSNATRSNPSLLGNSPSTHRSSLSPQHSSIGSNQDWSSRTGIAFGKHSPAHAPFNMATSPPTIATPGKLVLSPHYYDYTEEFNNEQQFNGTKPTSERLPPPSFFIEKTIHEDRKLSSDLCNPNDSFVRQSSVDIGQRDGSKSVIGGDFCSEDKLGMTCDEDHTERTANISQDIIPLYLDRSSYDMIRLESTNAEKPPSVYGTDIAVDEGIFSEETRINNLTVISRPTITNTVQKTGDYDNYNGKDGTETGSIYDKSSSFRISSLLPDFPDPPGQSRNENASNFAKAHNQPVPSDPVDKSPQIFDWQPCNPTLDAVDENVNLNTQPSHGKEQIWTDSSYTQGHISGVLSKAASYTKESYGKSSHCNSVDHNLQTSAELVIKIESKNELSHADVLNPDSTTLQNLPSLPAIERQQPQSRMDSQIVLNKNCSENDLGDPGSRVERPPPLTTPECQISNNAANGTTNGLMETLNSTRQFGEEPFLRPVSPMLAPQPISPVRILKLKNSIPQLMKALPPVPQGPIHLALPQRRASSCDLPSNASFPSRLSDFKTTQMSGSNHVGHSPPTVALATRSRPFYQIKQLPPTISLPYKIKLKSESSSSRRSTSLSPPNSRPWNLEMSYPWVGPQSDIPSASMDLGNWGLKRPLKFELGALETADDISGTVKINSNAKGGKGVDSLDLRNPKDLFTSAPKLSDVFRQVSKQFSPENRSTSAEAVLTEPILASSVTACPVSSIEVRSFFSDHSSQVRGYNGLRNRISNLRARFPHSNLLRSGGYMNRNYSSTQTSDRPALTNDIVGLNGNRTQVLDEYGMPVIEYRHQGLKAKVSGWFKEARLAVKWRGKTRGDTEARCILIYR